MSWKSNPDYELMNERELMIWHVWDCRRHPYGVNIAIDEVVTTFDNQIFTSITYLSETASVDH